MTNLTAGALLASISCGFKLHGHFLPPLSLGCPETGGGEESGGAVEEQRVWWKVLAQLMVLRLLRPLLFTRSGECG